MVSVQPLAGTDAVPDLAALQPGLRDAVVAAGRIAMDAFGRGGRSWEKSPGQVLTETDLAVDHTLKDSLGNLLQSAAWLSEESPDDGKRLTRSHVWVVDPIDGTRSFAKGRPEFTISVALVEAGRPVLACLLNPATDELFEARTGHGATLNRTRLDIAEPADRATARIVLSASERKAQKLDAFFPKAQVSSIGSLAYKMALVASGRFDAYFSWRRSQDWDIAAALLILTEAGGKATDRAGAPLLLNRADPRHQGLVAAPPGLHRQLLAISRKQLLARAEHDHGLQLTTAPR